MWNGILQNSSIETLTESVKFAERRHQLLASNIANLDTPGYLTQDLSVDNFHEALQDSIAASKQNRNLTGPQDDDSANNISKQQAQQHVHKVYEQILYHDGSDVSLEQQVTNISKNQAMHSTAISMLRHQMHTLQMAIAESVNV